MTAPAASSAPAAPAGGAAPRPRPDGLELAAWLVLAGLMAWLYGAVLWSMMGNWWDDPNYSHGFLVPLVAAYLIWRQRQDLLRVMAGPNPLGLVLVALGLAVLLIGQQAHEFYLRRVSLIPVLWGLVLLAWGWAVARRTMFAAAYLLLMVPLPYLLYDAVAFPLRLTAARLAGAVVRLFGVPVFVDGNALHLPHVVLDVVDACSGIRSLISLLAAGVILAYLMLPNRWLKLVVVALVVPVAIVTNGLRVAVAGLLAEFVGPQTLEGAMHDTVGWVVFMAAFLVLAGITMLLKKLGTRGGRDHAE